nr:hypothetical protein [Rhizobium sp. ACO-34A]
MANALEILDGTIHFYTMKPSTCMASPQPLSLRQIFEGIATCGGRHSRTAGGAPNSWNLEALPRHPKHDELLWRH